MENIQKLILKENEKIPSNGNIQIIIVNDENIEQRVAFYSNGLLHRENDLPAVYNLINGTTEWFIQGKRHRENTLPAVLHSTGLFEFWYNNKRHRTNGPAVHNLGEKENIWVREFDSCIIYDGLEEAEALVLYGPGNLFVENEYWIDGCRISRQEFLEK